MTRERGFNQADSRARSGGREGVKEAWEKRGKREGGGEMPDGETEAQRE